MSYTRQYKEFIGSNEWEELRIAAIRKRGFKCQNCGSSINLQVHHIDYDDMTTKVRVLCEKCHNIAHQDLECFE